MYQPMRLVLGAVLAAGLAVAALPAFAAAPQQDGGLTPDVLANATYQSDYATSGTITLVDGQAEEEIAPGSASKLLVTLIEPTAFGDLNGDGVDDAAVLLASESGGSGTFIDLHAVLDENGAPVDAASAFLGDRVQVNSLVIEDGLILVDLITQGPGDAMCCPTQQESRIYVLVDGELVDLTDDGLSLDTLGDLTYQTDMAPDGTAALVDGVYTVEGTPGTDGAETIERTGYGAFGDLNDDGAEDAAVVLIGGGGSGDIFHELAIVLAQDEAYVNAATEPLGADITIENLIIEDGKVIVEFIGFGPDDPECCPTQLLSRTYVMTDGTLQLVDESQSEAPTSMGGEFQPDAAPTAATLTLGGNEGYWLDPTLVSVIGGVVDGTLVQANTLGTLCAGVVAEQPDVVLEWAQDDAVESLRIFFLSLGDPTLVVVTPAGDILCNDDYSPLVADPFLSIDAPEAGRYAIYVGSFEDAAVEPGFLVVTSQDLNPAVMDLAQMFPRQANPDAVRNPQPAEAMKVDEAPQVAAAETIMPEATPFTQALTAGGGLGAFDVELDNQACTGFVTPAPTFTFDWEGEADKLVLFFEAADDTTLIVRNPNGTYQCNDDLDGSANLNPYLDLTPIPGSYQVWLGSYAPDVTVDGTLTITGDVTVRPAPLTSEMVGE